MYLVALVGMVACNAAGDPTPAPLLFPAIPSPRPAGDTTPTVPAHEVKVSPGPPTSQPSDSRPPEATASTPTLEPEAGPGSGIRAGQIIVPERTAAEAEEIPDYRPPPMPVPLSLHPDDHYWLARPIASDRRNFDLEWYPYGIEPMLEAAQPYRVHHGMDFPNSTGTPIFAASSGTVIHAGPLPSSRNGVNYYGNTVVILHDWQWMGEDVFTLYAHTLELFVEVGDRVETGQLIAGVGASGEVSGPHLHLEVRVASNDYASTRNPALWLAPYEGWGTLAGRFVDSLGRTIHGAQITLIPIRLEAGAAMTIRRQRTYSPQGPNPDEIWLENFVVTDLPAGSYRLLLRTAGSTFRRDVEIRPGLTNFVIVQADFAWAPSPTPTQTPTPASTPSPGTVTPDLSATASPSATNTPTGQLP